MEKILEKIGRMSMGDLQEVMRAVENRYAEACPEWDVLYIAIHKAPDLRRRELADLLALMAKGEK